MRRLGDGQDVEAAEEDNDDNDDDDSEEDSEVSQCTEKALISAFTNTL